jgi:hypothetical protein
MKKILIALAVVVFDVSALHQVRGADVSIDFFYDNLSGGNWIDVEGYGYGWQPDVAVNDQNWRPYADGYWAYTDDGWTWISYEDFGWATYHYGRWANLSDNGWVWFPGEDLDWGPAWVSWRTGGDYVGWAPLPPRGPGVVYEGQPIGPQVDIEFDIGPQFYNFCEVRYIGEPILRNYIAPPVQNITYINNTVNVTNITVRNNVVYNYGPNYEALSARSARPIQRLNIERQSATNLSAAVKSGALTKVQGNKLVVAAPAKLAKAPPTVRPPTVKTKIAQPRLNRGWAGVANEAQLKQKIKTENPKNIPPPTAAAARGGVSPRPGVGASLTPPNAGGAPVTPVQRGKPNRVPPGSSLTPPTTGGIPITPAQRGKPNRVPPGARPTPPAARVTPAGAPVAVSPSPFERSKPPGAVGAQPRPVATTPARGPETKPAQPLRPSPLPARGKPQNQFGPAPRQVEPPANTSQQGRGKTLGTEPRRISPPATPVPRQPRGAAEQGQPARPPASAAPGGPRSSVEREQSPRNKPPTTPLGGGQGEARGRRETQGAYAQPGGQPRGGQQPAVEMRQAKPEQGKKKGEGTPPPRPQ